MYLRSHCLIVLLFYCSSLCSVPGLCSVFLSWTGFETLGNHGFQGGELSAKFWVLWVGVCCVAHSFKMEP